MIAPDSAHCLYSPRAARTNAVESATQPSASRPKVQGIFVVFRTNAQLGNAYCQRYRRPLAVDDTSQFRVGCTALRVGTAVRLSLRMVTTERPVVASNTSTPRVMLPTRMWWLLRGSYCRGKRHVSGASRKQHQREQRTRHAQRVWLHRGPVTHDCLERRQPASGVVVVRDDHPLHPALAPTNAPTRSAFRQHTSIREQAWCVVSRTACSSIRVTRSVLSLDVVTTRSPSCTPREHEL